MLSKRVEILLDPAEMEALRREAKKAKKSVGALIREAVKEKFLTPTSKDRKEALKRLLSPQRALSFPSWKKIKKELEDSMKVWPNSKMEILHIRYGIDPFAYS